MSVLELHVDGRGCEFGSLEAGELRSSESIQSAPQDITTATAARPPRPPAPAPHPRAHRPQRRRLRGAWNTNTPKGQRLQSRLALSKPAALVAAPQQSRSAQPRNPNTCLQCSGVVAGSLRRLCSSPEKGPPPMPRPMAVGLVLTRRGAKKRVAHPDRGQGMQRETVGVGRTEGRIISRLPRSPPAPAVGLELEGSRLAIRLVAADLTGVNTSRPQNSGVQTH